MLSGKRSLRRRTPTPPYTRVVDAQVHACADRWDAMSEEEKELARVGEHQLAELGQQPDPAAPEGVRSDDDDFDIGPNLRADW